MNILKPTTKIELNRVQTALKKELASEKIIQDIYVYKIEFKKDDEWVNVNGKVLLIK